MANGVMVVSCAPHATRHTLQLVRDPALIAIDKGSRVGIEAPIVNPQLIVPQTQLIPKENGLTWYHLAVDQSLSVDHDGVHATVLLFNRRTVLHPAATTIVSSK